MKRPSTIQLLVYSNITPVNKLPTLAVNEVNNAENEVKKFKRANPDWYRIVRCNFKRLGIGRQSNLTIHLREFNHYFAIIWGAIGCARQIRIAAIPKL